MCKVYKKVPEFPYVFVSKDAEFITYPRCGLRRDGFNGREYPGQVLAQCTHKINGYVYVKLCLLGKNYTKTVHSLVCSAWKGERPEGMTIEHLDKNKENNHVNNLMYMTQSENNRRGYNSNQKKRGAVEYYQEDLPGEIWKDIYNNKVSNLGRVIGYQNKKPIIKKQHLHHTGYLVTGVNKAGNRKTKRIHRLMAEAFGLDISGKIRHKNGIKTDNRLENLEAY